MYLYYIELFGSFYSKNEQKSRRRKKKKYLCRNREKKKNKKNKMLIVRCIIVDQMPTLLLDRNIEYRSIHKLTENTVTIVYL